MPRILVIDSNPDALNDVVRADGRPAFGDGYAGVLHALRADIETVVVAPYDGDEVPPLDGFDGVVFTGSTVEWNTDDPRAEPLAAAMRRAFAQGVPTIGSCNGMQLAASVLGGSTQASPNGREDGLARDIRLTEQGRAHPMLAGRRDGFAVPCAHRDEVRRLPEGAVLLAGNAHSPVQAFAYERDGVKFWGMQYHPEYSPAELSGPLGKSGRVSAQTAADLACAETDPAAAARLGTSVDEQKPVGRTIELQNWLNTL